MNNIKTHSELFKKFNWDIIIILDACRLDSFIKILPDIYLDNCFQVVNSEASATTAWLEKHWGNDFHMDIVYISGTPFVNSKGICIEDTSSFDGRNHFGIIFDTWDWGFNKKTGRVEPEAIVQDAIVAGRINSGARLIIHFMQPHSPYLFEKKKLEPLAFLHKLIPKKIFQFLRHRIPTLIRYNTSIHIPEYNQHFLYSDDEIQKAYEKNLKSVEKYLKILIDFFSDKNIIITSDHAEYLGEDGKYGHGGELNDFITSVPFVKIIGDKKWQE